MIDPTNGARPDTAAGPRSGHAGHASSTLRRSHTRRGRSRTLLGGTVAAVMVGALTACGGAGAGGGEVEQGSLGQELKGMTFTVGSKDFTENRIFGHLTIQLLQGHGATVTDKTNIKGSVNVRKALLAKEVDMYWDYSGTGWITYLKHTKPIPGSAEQFAATAKEDLEKNGVVWIGPTPLNNTYALAIRSEKAKELGVTTLSQVAEVVRTKPNEATFCIEDEFASRDDGWPGLTKTYGMNVPADNVKKLATGVVYKETDEGQTCNFGEVFTTDGRIASMGLTVLQDDKKFFPIYNAALTLRKETADKYPQIKKILDPVIPKLTDQQMQAMSAKVDVEGHKHEQVAHDWLVEQGLLKAGK
jgi:osmoprotectant transport system substrate-binding protein